MSTNTLSSSTEKASPILTTQGFLEIMKKESVSFTEIEDAIGELGINFKDEVIQSVTLDETISSKRKMMFFQAIGLSWMEQLSKEEQDGVRLLIGYYTRLGAPMDISGNDVLKATNSRVRYSINWMLYRQPSFAISIGRAKSILSSYPFSIPEKKLKPIIETIYVDA